MTWPFKGKTSMPKASAPKGGQTSGGGKPVCKPLPMKQPVGPKRSGTGTNHGNCGTQNKG